MKYIVSLALLLTALSAQAEDFNYADMYGIWQVSPIGERNVVFGSERSETSITAEFHRAGDAEVEGNHYYWQIEKGVLLLSKNPPRKGKLHFRIDRIQVSGQINDCLKAKIVKKGIAGYYMKKEFSMCKMRGEPLYTKPY